MGSSVLKQFLFALVALLFVGANLSTNCAATTIENSGVIAAPLSGGEHPCMDCSGNAPTIDFTKMGCGVLSCPGIVALPTHIVALPQIGKSVHSPGTVDEMSGISLAPDPLPPRTTVRV